MENSDLSMFTSTVKYAGEHIFIQPFCDFFGIQYKNQTKIISTSNLLKRSVCKKRSMLLFGDERERVALTKEGFITWILQLRSQIVHPNLQEKLVEYQTKIFAFMFGAVENEKKVRRDYARLNKLRALKSKISSEIYVSEQGIHEYLDGKLVQYQLPFKETKSNLPE